MAGFGDRIKMVRGTLSREKFSALTGISKTALVNYETGLRTPSADYLAKVLEEYPHISPAWLLMGEDEMERGEKGTSQRLSLSDIKYMMTVEDDLLRLKKIHQSVDEIVSKYDFDLIREKRFTLSMTLFGVFSKDFCKNQEGYFERTVDSLVRLCIPDERFSNADEVKLHIALAWDALQNGELNRTRAEYLKAAKMLEQVVEMEGGTWTDDLELAKKEFTDFVNADSVYRNGLTMLLPIIKATPGILQTDLYKACPGIERETISYILYFAASSGVIKRTKKGRTYELHAA